MKIKLIMLALCFSLILATASCNKAKSGPSSGKVRLGISDTSVNFYFTEAFSKNKKQQIILAFWDNIPQGESESSGEELKGSTDITYYLTRSNPTVKFQCVGKLDNKTGKGTVDIAGKTFDVSSGRLFLINTHVKPLKVIQVNEQFNLPPFDNLSWLDDVFSSNKRIRSNAFPAFQEKIEYLAKNNKEVAAFLAQSNSLKDKPKTQ